MKLVIVPIFLTLALNGIHGVSVGNYEGNDQYQNEEPQNYGNGNNQDIGNAEYNGQEQEEYHSNGLGDHQALVSDQSYQGGGEDDGGHLPQWQGGFEASQGLGAVEQDHSAHQQEAGQLSDYSASPGLGYGGHDFGGGHDYPDLKPRVEFEHHHIPTRTIEKTEVQHIPVVKKIGVPVPHPVGVPTPQIIKVPVPQPYAVHVPVPHPIAVPIYRLVPQEVEKKVPIEVEKLVPVYVDKPYKIEIEKHHVEYVDKPYPVHVPVYKHIYHHVPKHGSGGHSGGH